MWARFVHPDFRMEFRLVFLTAIAAGIVIFGCAGGGSANDLTNNDTGNSDAGKVGEGGDNSPEGEGGPTKSPSDTSGARKDAGSPRIDAGHRDAGKTGAGGGACSSSTSADDCTNCCFSAHQNGADVYQGAAGECACDQPGACATQCANSFCGQNGDMPQPGDACDRCLSGASDCISQALSACQADQDCQAMLDCIDQSGCQNK